MGLMTGSEGLLGVVTEVTVRLLRKPSTARAVLLGFPTEAGAADCVAAVIASGIIPGGMEMMDKDAVKCAEAYVGAGYPTRRRGPADRRARRPVGRGRLSGGARRGDRPRARRHDGAREPRRAGAGAVLGRPQGCVPRGRPDHARLYVPRRLGAARQAGRGAGRDAADVEEAWPARGQRLPCRRRQPASADPVRRQRSRRAAAAPRSSAPISCGSACAWAAC